MEESVKYDPERIPPVVTRKMQELAQICKEHNVGGFFFAFFKKETSGDFGSIMLFQDEVSGREQLETIREVIAMRPLLLNNGPEFDEKMQKIREMVVELSNASFRAQLAYNPIEDQYEMTGG